MDLRDCLRAVRRRWRLVVVLVLLAVGGSIVLTARQAPQYATSVTFFVTTPNRGVTDAYQGGLFSQQRVKSYATLLTSDRLAKAVVDSGRAGGLTPSQVSERIQARAVPETVLLQVSVTDRYRMRSQQLAEALVSQFSALVATLETPPGASTPSVKVEVTSGPLLNPSPVAPQPLRNVGLALLIGLAAGLACALLREALDTTVKSANVIDDLVGAPVLGAVPYTAAARRSPLIVDAEAHGMRAEAVRQVRTNLQFVDVDEPLKVIAVTSAVAGEGKSTTATNLAIAFSEAGRKVLLVEADLRRPSLAEYLRLPAPVGLTDVLAGQVYLEDALLEWDEGQFWVLPSGSTPPNPSVLLGSRHMMELLETLQETFDTIIIDTPPLLPVTDAAVVAARVDGAIMVVRHGRTTRAEVRAAAHALHAVGARVLGCVLNMAPTHSGPSYYYQGAVGDGRSEARSEARSEVWAEIRSAEARSADATGGVTRPRTAPSTISAGGATDPAAGDGATVATATVPAPAQAGVPGRHDLSATGETPKAGRP